MYGASFFVLVALLSFSRIFLPFPPFLPSANPRWPLRRSSPLSSIFAVVLVDAVPHRQFCRRRPFCRRRHRRQRHIFRRHYRRRRFRRRRHCLISTRLDQCFRYIEIMLFLHVPLKITIRYRDDGRNTY